MFEIIPMKQMSRSFWSPYREMDNLARAFFNDSFFSAKETSKPFRTDIKKTENGYLLEADLPGVDKKDISIDIEGERLTVKAQRSCEIEEENKKDNYVRIERSYGTYERSFDISGIDTDKIGAKYENGVLTLTLPEKEQIKPESRKLEIE